MMALKYKEGTSTTDHVSEFQSMMNQLLGMGVKFDDEILGLWLLATLLDSWETFRASLINSAPQGNITLDLAKSCVLNEEFRRSSGSTQQSEVLKGHIKKYCFKLKRENKGGGHKHDRNDEEKSERVVVTCEDLMVICDENLVNLVCDETSWMIDTGTSTHITSRRDFFTSYTLGDYGVLKMGNYGLVPVTGIGDVSLVRNNGTRVTLKDVRHALDIHLNLIYAGKLDDEGFCNTFSDGQWKLTKDAKLPISFWPEALNTVAHVINLSPSVPLRGEVLDKVWFGKDVSYDHLHVFDCKAFVNVSKDGRSKLDAKTRQFIFIGYGLDSEFGYRLYYPTEKEGSPDSGDLTDVNPVPLDPSPNPIQDDVHGDVNDDQQDIGDFDAPIDDVVTDQQQALIAQPTIPLWRSSRDR
ncbi:hypothetical protein V6N12_017988 [Hibiscus sabdariffa]|uniref:Uncharacterized protein n=1 Tax=Hibiscus sabdariffa TaxID=183260 RepID=A0ABR2ATN2_9ROSI